MSEHRFPIAKMMTPGKPEPHRIVTLLDYQWWKQVTPMEQASRAGLLRCALCDGPFLYASGPVKGTYFRHRYRSCLQGSGQEEPKADSPYPPARTMWIRYEFARLLERLLPPGSTVDDKPALTDRNGHIKVTLPGGRRLAVEVDCHPAGFASVAQRLQAHERSGIPVIWVFSGLLLTPQIASAGDTVSTPLDPLVVAVRERCRSRRLDRAYQAQLNQPGTEAPVSLLFYKPADSEQPGTVMGLKGLTPGRKDLWTGRVVRNALRVTPSRGMVFAEDGPTLRQYRSNLQEERRAVRYRAQEATARERAARAPLPASARLHDMVLAPTREWMQLLLETFTGRTQAFTISEPCRFVAARFDIHPDIRDPLTPRFLDAMLDFWRFVAEKGLVQILDRHTPIRVLPLKRQ